jgi:hypothetical protein
MSFGAKSEEQGGCTTSLKLELLDRGRHVSWSIVMVENPIVGLKFGPFSKHDFS